MNRSPRTLLAILTEEALRLFFPLCALHAAAWPLVWTWALRLGPPFGQTTPPSLWHGHEMLYGAYGAALIGFLFTAAPEWTHTPRPSARLLLSSASLWIAGRLFGLAGADGLGLVGGVADITWLAILLVWLAHVAWRSRSSALVSFLFCLFALLAWEVGFRQAVAQDSIGPAQGMLERALLTFCALLGLALMRITPPITNRILDPDRSSTPFRPHPGRRYLAPALVALALVAGLAGGSAPVTGYLLIAAGAAFLDRVAESFIGPRFFKLEILALAGSAALTGGGLILLRASRLGAPHWQIAAIHTLAMGGLGLGVLGVFSIAGRLHTGQALGLSRAMGAAFGLALLATGLRAAASLGLLLPGPAHGLAAIAWASAFAIWLWQYWPAFSTSSNVAHVTGAND